MLRDSFRGGGAVSRTGVRSVRAERSGSMAGQHVQRCRAPAADLRRHDGVAAARQHDMPWAPEW